MVRQALIPFTFLTLTFLTFCRSCFSCISCRTLHKGMSSKDCNSCQELWQEGEKSTGEWPSHIPVDLNLLPLLPSASAQEPWAPAPTPGTPLKCSGPLRSADGEQLNLASLPHAYPGCIKYLLSSLDCLTAISRHSILTACSELLAA